MGYSEVLCHICGVGFNIGRIRIPTEPRSAAWSATGSRMSKNVWETVGMSKSTSYVDGSRAECRGDSGCTFTIRKAKDDNRDNVHDQDDEDDDDWVSSGDEEQDRLEYSSDASSSDEHGESHSADIDMTDASDDVHKTPTREEIRQFWLQGLTEPRDGYGLSVPLQNLINEDERYQAWHRGIPYHIELDDAEHDQVDDVFPLFHQKRHGNSKHGTDTGHYRTTSKLGYHDEDRHHVEHIAGIGCENTAGYSGHEIGVEEMRGCQTLQCLVRKPEGYLFSPSADDEEFETTGDFFLSGLSDYMPSRDDNIPRVTPPRHGCKQPHAENSMWDKDEAYNYAMPFHPWCFEIFKRVSTLLYGKVDVVGLTSWWLLEANFKHFDRFPRDPNVLQCQHQEWQHVRGTSYLVANPLYMPKLKDIFASAIQVCPDFDPRNGAFTLLESTLDKPTMDPFLLLPVELRIQILDLLPSKDISALRLSSRAFCQIPVYYFQKLIFREMPWLWEAWPSSTTPSPMPYSFWATTTASNAKVIFEKREREYAILNDYVETIAKEMPELGPQLYDALPQLVHAMDVAQQRQLANNQDLFPFHLPPTSTNYFRLYTLITRHWQHLRGLRNRKRIWEDCQEILSRISKYREAGRIGENGITENLRDVIFKNWSAISHS